MDFPFHEPVQPSLKSIQALTSTAPCGRDLHSWASCCARTTSFCQFWISILPGSFNGLQLLNYKSAFNACSPSPRHLWFNTSLPFFHHRQLPKPTYSFLVWMLVQILIVIELTFSWNHPSLLFPQFRWSAKYLPPPQLKNNKQTKNTYQKKKEVRIAFW